MRRLVSLAFLLSLSACVPSRPPSGPQPPPSADRTKEFTDTCTDVYRTELRRDPDAGGLDGCIDQARGGKTKDDLIAWIRTTPEYIALHTKPPVRPGLVTLCGAHGLCDGAGRHYFGGVSIFPAAWAFRNDRAWLDGALEDVKPGEHDFARIFGHLIGPDPWWADRHNDLTQPGAVDATGATIDYLVAKGGLRSWFVVFADTSYTPAIRSGIVDALIPVLKARQAELFAIELVNEAELLKPTPFPIAEAKAYAQRIKAALPETVVIVSSPKSESCADLQLVSIGDASAPHYSREVSGTKGIWTPPSQPWMGDTQPRFCGGRATFDGEPIGLGSSGKSDNDPIRLAMARATGGSAGNAADVFHSNAGVYARIAFHEQAGFTEAQESVRQMRALLNTKPDLQDWSRGRSDDGPWTVRTLPNGHAGIDGTIDRFYCTWRGADSWCAGLNVRANTTLTAKSPMHVSVRAGGAALTELLARDVNAGESITVAPATHGVVVIGSPR